ncbi:peptide-methionine (S)-S-oxide reductase MsrA [Helicobacter sp. MIT 14-3879]|uniref:peptide-methionine (S)-S-oxide reductase MsrA n=1 Tax=Helicobacter sp. MIT 14-3879 TaxID=2040649 RepID=UPI000E1E3E7C|nr:peptide-methionine (S)-S-oxide reductase MsrA [Helicobacter sp. MIT 14-3879]RDU63487.1 peptide-methionine (S)-S-oxide reductase [Helicobacter sp. MIT 14-3879]
MKIYLAGGCFWGVEAYFGYINGVIKTSVGYANSNIENPTYEQVCSGKTGSVECVEIIYDEVKITLDYILDEFFSIINPYSINKQGNDIGEQYRSGIYYINDIDKQIIQNYIDSHFKEKIATEIKYLQNYFLAESYHQKYLKKNPNGYCHIDLSKFI